MMIFTKLLKKIAKKAIADIHKFNLEPGKLNCNLPLIVDDKVDDSENDENQNENNNLYVSTRENNTVTSDSIRVSTSRNIEQKDDEFLTEDILEDCAFYHACLMVILI